MITTVSEDGSTNIGPYQLTVPLEVIKERSFLVCSRKGSNTETNLHRNPRCALNFVEFNRKQLKKIVGLGYPGQTTEEKMADSPFTLIESPTPGRGTADGCPLIIKEAFQVHEAHWDESFRIKDDGKTPEYLVLRLENILLKETWAKNIENGTRRMPNMPITFGFRDGEKFWFAERKSAFWFPTPTDKGAKEESVLYEANRHRPGSQVHPRGLQATDRHTQALHQDGAQGDHQAGQGARRHRGRPRIRRDAEQGARLTAVMATTRHFAGMSLNEDSSAGKRSRAAVGRLLHGVLLRWFEYGAAMAA